MGKGVAGQTIARYRKRYEAWRRDPRALGWRPGTQGVGVCCTYVAMIFEEVKKRPLTIVKEVHQSTAQATAVRKPAAAFDTALPPAASSAAVDTPMATRVAPASRRSSVG